MSHSTFSLGLVGFSGHSLAMLEMFLNKHNSDFYLSDQFSSDAVIYNADQPKNIDDQYNEYLKKYNIPGVIVSAKGVVWENMVTLKKPYSQQDLRIALGQLRSQIIANKSDEEIATDTKGLENSEVLEVFRRKLNPDQVISDQLGHLKQQNQHRREFQHQLLSRKRAADKVLELHKAGLLAESFAAPAEKSHPETNTEDSESCRLSLEEQEQLGVGESNIEPPAQIFNLKPATEQEIRDCCSNIPDLDLTDRTQRRRVMFNPEGQLLAMVLAAMKKAHREECGVAVVGVPNLHLVYQPDLGKFFSAMDEELLILLAHVRFKFGELSLKHISPEVSEKMRLQSDFTFYSSNQLLWRLACWSSGGRLIGDIDIDASYRLEEMPDPDVLIGLPYTQALIDAWSGNAQTVHQVISRLGAEQRYVFPFMTAAWVLNWLRKQ